MEALGIAAVKLEDTSEQLRDYQRELAVDIESVSVRLAEDFYDRIREGALDLIDSCAENYPDGLLDNVSVKDFEEEVMEALMKKVKERL